jgi:hypothetical protein
VSPGLPFAVWPGQRPTAEAEAFLRLLAAQARPGPAMRPEPPARGWLEAYRLVRCASCGAAVRTGTRCRQCGGPR